MQETVETKKQSLHRTVRFILTNNTTLIPSNTNDGTASIPTAMQWIRCILQLPEMYNTNDVKIQLAHVTAL